MRFPFLLETLKFVLKHFFENLNLVPKRCITHYFPIFTKTFEKIILTPMFEFFIENELFTVFPVWFPFS